MIRWWDWNIDTLIPSPMDFQFSSPETPLFIISFWASHYLSRCYFRTRIHLHPLITPQPTTSPRSPALFIQLSISVVRFPVITEIALSPRWALHSYAFQLKCPAITADTSTTSWQCTNIAITERTNVRANFMPLHTNLWKIGRISHSMGITDHVTPLTRNSLDILWFSGSTGQWPNGSKTLEPNSR